jgi:hypothetical protein
MTTEFTHSYNHKKPDPENCSACALTIPVMIDYGPNDTRLGINYSAWPLSYLQNGRSIPDKFLGYLKEELKSDNLAYVENLKKHLIAAGYDLESLK